MFVVHFAACALRKARCLPKENGFEKGVFHHEGHEDHEGIYAFSASCSLWVIVNSPKDFLARAQA
jgi:hypothetical protein